MATISILTNLTPTDFDAGSIFSGSPSGKLIKGFAEPCPFTPRHDPSYIFHAQIRDIAVWFLGASDPMYVFGPTGCGKTSCIK